MSVVVLIPWRATTCPCRTRALEFVLARYAQAGYEVAVGRHDEGAWCKAAAVADALAQTQAEILIVADADVWAEGLREAVEHVRAGTGWAIPHRGVLRLSDRATRVLLATGECDITDLAQAPYLGVEGGGVIVLRREAYEACSIDPRFRGWGSEDEAHGFALRTLYGPPRRVKRPLIHLWHPPQERATRAWGSRESWELRRRYARASGSESAMRALIEEGRAHDVDRTLESLGHARPAVA